MKNRTIREKITLLFIVFLAVILGLSYIVYNVAHLTVVRGITETDLEEAVDIDMEQVRWHPKEPAPDAGEGVQVLPWRDGWLSIDEDFMELMDGVGVGLYDAQHRLLYGEDLIAAENAATAFRQGQVQTIRSGPDIFYVYDRQIKTEDGQVLWLRGAVDRDQHQEEIAEVQHYNLLLYPLLILLAAIGAYLITRRCLAPIGRMVKTAGSIGSGSDLQQRIHIDAGPRNEIQQLATSFNAMMQRLEGSFEAEKRFTSDVSHELRTPMATILAQCELALENDEMTAEEAREALQVIQRQGGRMNELIEDMLTYTRIERQHERYVREPLDLAEVVRQTCGEFRMRHSGVALDLEIAADTEEAVVCGNALLLDRLVSNLLENAFRYGGAGAAIRVRLARPEGRSGRGSAGTGPADPPGARDREGQDTVWIQVADDGPGIAPQHLPRIFDRFYQADPARSGEGTGLGLAMVREIAGLHGGSVRADSRLGEGSTFTVELPALADRKKNIIKQSENRSILANIGV